MTRPSVSLVQPTKLHRPILSSTTTFRRNRKTRSVVGVDGIDADLSKLVIRAASMCQAAVDSGPAELSEYSKGVKPTANQRRKQNDNDDCTENPLPALMPFPLFNRRLPIAPF
jgi:hypothetical protein